MKDMNYLEAKLAAFVDEAAGNYVAEKEALTKELAGLKLYEAPLLGAASADDSLFLELKEEEAIGPHFMLPTEWMPEGRTVLSFFLPYTSAIKNANALDNKEPADAWLHGRVEGHTFLIQACKYLKNQIHDLGGNVVIPAADPRFWRTESPKGAELKDYGFTSNWSERHIGFICGLGTFGLSRGLITEAGIAGRLSSVITDLDFTPTQRKYSDLYEYCTRCGACIQRCPVKAISFESGKEHRPCGRFLNYTKENYAPRYGCGKCQTGVPCESGRP